MRRDRKQSIWVCRLIPIILSIVVLTSCQGPQKPTWKEQVSEALDYYYQGEEELKKGNLDAAEQFYLTSLEISPRPAAYIRTALIKNQRGDSDGAMADLDRALKMSPGYRRAQVLREQLLLRQGESLGESSISTRSDSAESQPPLISEESPAGEELIEALQIDESETEESKPPVEDATQKLSEEALPVEEEKPIEKPAISTAPPEIQSPGQPSLQPLVDQVRDAIGRKDWALVQSLSKKIVDLDSQNVWAFYQYGYACFQLQQLEEAKTAFEKTIELNPQNSDAYNDLGVTLERLNQSGAAAKAYQKAVDLGGNSDALFNLALLKEKRGEYKDSVELYEKYLEVDAGSLFADYARQRIEKLRRLAY
ncbi:MAG: tetratricopeptide repeat protein [Candidatus Omnitrophica bacterium]|nr:tetratricopeptide repeat protein [Candidatus Omnitrophota bacterium]